MEKKENIYGDEVNGISSADDSFIGENVKIKGNLTSSGKIIIHGKINGNISSEISTIIEKSGEVKGKIKANNIDLFGRVNGILKSDGKITIHSTGNFSGELSSKIFIVEEGAVFNGTANSPED